jgi:hypothetical protein
LPSAERVPAPPKPAAAPSENISSSLKPPDLRS